MSRSIEEELKQIRLEKARVREGLGCSSDRGNNYRQVIACNWLEKWKIYVDYDDSRKSNEALDEVECESFFFFFSFFFLLLFLLLFFLLF